MRPKQVIYWAVWPEEDLREILCKVLRRTRVGEGRCGRELLDWL